MTMTIDDPKFIASWQKVKECQKCLDEDQVERLFSKEHTSLLEFNQALAEELRLKEASLRSTVLVQNFVIIQWLNFTTEHTNNDPSCW